MRCNGELRLCLVCATVSFLFALRGGVTGSANKPIPEIKHVSLHCEEMQQAATV